MIKKGLGRGLDALFSAYGNDEEPSELINQQKEIVRSETSDAVVNLDMFLIDPNKNQPRKNFNAESLKELSESIKQHGVIQPITVNDQGNGRYLIVAGERRFRASLNAGLKKIPAVIKKYTDKEIKEISLVENLQREDLNPIESAKAIRELMDAYGYTQEAVSDRIGKSRPLIANTLRLLNLYPEVVSLIEKGRLSAGHGRALVPIINKDLQIKIALQACDNKLNVREIENLVKKYLNPAPTKKSKSFSQSLELRNLENQMQRCFSTKVTILGDDNKGKISIDYFNRDDLERINSLIEKLRKF